MIDSFTIFCLIFIVVAFILAWGYIINSAKKNKLIERKRWIEQLPSLISTLGVLGTFMGITKGLLRFNSDDLTASIPQLLDGLKTAFFTSLAGMVGSLVLSRVVSRVYDDLDKGTSDINIAAGQITQAVNQMCQTIVNNTQQQTSVQSAFYNNVSQILSQIQASQNSLDNNTTQILTIQLSLNTNIQNIAGAISQIQVQQTATNNTLQSLIGLNQKNNELLKITKEYVSTITESTSEIDRIVENVGDVMESLSATQNDISDEVKAMGGKLHNEVVEIEDKMDGTNKLLSEKFDEFSKLLEKSNTEALVEVMKKVTEEFQKQMGELINKLVQENFDQLNKSVERLNTWQIENKEMIKSLTAQYKSMENDFEATSKTLQNVGEDTKALVSDGSKLNRIIAALNAVMVDDKRFVEITNNLNQAAELNKTSMTEFKDAQSSLNEWVRKQRNFVEAVQILIKQLEDISKINDYSKEFWKGTRNGMNDGLAIIQQGSQELIKQIQNLDGHFYTRLNTTLANLDQCIQKMIDKN